DGTFRYAGTMHVNGSLRFFDAGLPSLAGAIGDVSSFVNGRVTGRVDFAGAEMTSINDLNPTVSAKLLDSHALQLPAPSVLVPVTVALRVADLLVERTVYLRVTGTAKTPVIQVEPLRTISDEAVRFFIGRALTPAPLP